MYSKLNRGMNTTVPVDPGELTFALERLAMGFESEDPHIRHEAKMVAKQNLTQLATELNDAE